MELPFKVERLFEFNQQVNFQVNAPNGVAGLQIQNLSLPGDKADGVVTITAQANATPGEHKLTVVTSMNFNGQNLTFERSLILSIEKVDPPPK